MKHQKRNFIERNFKILLCEFEIFSNNFIYRDAREIKEKKRGKLGGAIKGRAREHLTPTTTCSKEMAKHFKK